MKPFCLVLVGVVVGWAASGVDWTRDAVGEDSYDRVPPSANAGGQPYTAPPVGVRERDVVDPRNGRTMRIRENYYPRQAAPAELVGRFQASAYGSPNGHGCYIVDTMTGQTWHILNGQPPQAVAAGLTAYAPQPAMPAAVSPYRPSTPTFQPVPSVVPTPQHAEPAPMPQTTTPSYSEPKIEESQAPTADVAN